MSTAILMVIGFILLLFLFFGFSSPKTVPKISIEQKFTEETSKAYDRISKWPQFAFLRILAVRKARYLGANGLIVDVGCGPGLLISKLLKEFPKAEIIGVDLFKSQLDKARENLKYKNVKFIEGDSQSLPFADSSVDFIISTLSLHHWSDPVKAFKEFQRVLKPGGKVLIFDLRRDSPRFFQWLIRFATRFVVPKPIRIINEPLTSLLSSHTIQELKSLMSATEFTNWHIEKGFGWSYSILTKQ